MQFPEDDLHGSCHSLYEQQLQTPILRHPSISQDQQAVVRLQQTSKQLQVAMAWLLRGQLPVALHTSQLQQVKLLAQWLRKHAGLVKSLDVCYMGPGSDYETHPNPAAAVARVLESAMAAAATAAAPGSLQLQSLSIDVAVEPTLLQHLPAARLTQLDITTSLCREADVAAISRLTSLQELRLTSIGLVLERLDMMQQLAAGLQQLTQLYIGPLQPGQLQHLPPKLQQLHAVVSIEWRNTAQIAALCRQELTALHSLYIQAPSSDASWQEDTVLAPLSVLQQLTRLKLDVVRRAQLQQLQLPQLQILEVWCSHTEESQLLRTGHLTALQKLSLQSYSRASRQEDQLPPNLQELRYKLITQQGDAEQGGRLLPLLGLSRLKKLQLEFGGAPTVTAEELKQLSRLSCLQELGLSYWGCTMADAAATTAALQALPLKSLQLVSDEVPGLVLGQLGQLQSLTRLEVQAARYAPSGINATPDMLAGVLQQLTSLRCLTVEGYDSMAADGSGLVYARDSLVEGVWQSVDGVRALLHAVGGLSRLEQVNVVLPVSLQESVVQQLEVLLLQQLLLPGKLARGCQVQTDRVAIKLRSVSGRQPFWGDIAW
jgi:hypothetical protein